jgi:hypothetical protein
MLASQDLMSTEYAALLERSRDLERTANATWAIATATAAVLLAWGLRANSPGILLSSVFSVAAGFAPLLHARQQQRLIAGYVEEFIENAAGAGGPRWNTKLGQLQLLPGVDPVNEWIAVTISNALVLVSIIGAWLLSKPAAHGELYAGAVTACGAIFALHSITQTSRAMRIDYAGVWHKVNGPQVVERRTSAAA